MAKASKKLGLGENMAKGGNKVEVKKILWNLEFRF